MFGETEYFSGAGGGDGFAGYVRGDGADGRRLIVEEYEGLDCAVDSVYAEGYLLYSR